MQEGSRLQRVVPSLPPQEPMRHPSQFCVRPGNDLVAGHRVSGPPGFQQERDIFQHFYEGWSLLGEAAVQRTVVYPPPNGGQFKYRPI